jgi:transposase InsO family protein
LQEKSQTQETSKGFLR